jgi:hypothetical protein
MNERGVAGRWGARLPWGLLGALVLIAGGERFVARRTAELTQVEFLDWRASRQAAAREAPRCPILCFGSSRAQMSLIPRLISDRTGLPCWNLATVAGPPPAFYYLLKQTLDHGARPAAVVVEHHPDFMGGPGKNTPAGLWAELLEPGDCLDLAWSLGSGSFLAESLLGSLVPSIKDRRQVRQHVRAALAGTGATDPGTHATLVNRARNRGALVLADNPSYHGEARQGTASLLLPAGPWSCHPVQDRYIRRFLDLAASRQIRVYWLVPPVSPQLGAERERRGLEASLTRAIARYQHDYPDLTVLDARRSGYEARVFNDPVHLTRRGATTLSADVADVLRRHTPSSPRWVNLPPYRPVPLHVPVEELPETVLALRAATARK